MPRFPQFRTCMPLACDAFDRNRGGFPAADAERSDTALEVLRLHRMQQRHDQPRTGCANRMAERAGAAIDVELFAGNAEVTLRGHRDHRERLVDLEQIDVTDAPADL